MAITGPVIVPGENILFGQVVGHRGGGRKGVSYGPTFTAEGHEENIRLGMQFPGPSRHPFFHRTDVQRGERELRELGGKFDDKGLFVWPNGRKQDSAEAIREHLGRRKIEYPKARYDDHVVMHSDQYPWKPLERASGVEVKHLGYFNELGPNVKLIRIDATVGSSRQPSRQRCRHRPPGSFTHLQSDRGHVRRAQICRPDFAAIAGEPTSLTAGA